MIVLNVGAQKNGTTWLQRIIGEFPIERYIPQLPEGRPKIDFIEDTVKSYRDEGAYIVFKHHFCLGSELANDNPLTFLENRSVHCVNIIRDIRDVLVSAYHHHKALGRVEDFQSFFDERARKIFDFQIYFQSYWLFDAPDVLGERLLHLSYESMLENFENNVFQLARFLCVSHPLNFGGIKEQTSIKALKSRHQPEWMSAFNAAGTSFYRKGKTGDHSNYFNDEQARAVEAWMEEDAFQRVAERAAELKTLGRQPAFPHMAAAAAYLERNRRRSEALTI